MALKTLIGQWAREVGFADCRIAALETAPAAQRLRAWLDAGRHGGMDYMERHFALRADAHVLLPEARVAVLVRMDYLSAATPEDWRERAWEALDAPLRANISRYAHGRDYHKVLRTRLQRLAERIGSDPAGAAHRYRVFTDSAPVMEVALATQAGLGWRGKHTLLLNREAGSMFFLGGFYTSLDLAPDAPRGAHCGACTACIDICPTQAIVAPYELDARRCISYLTIEHDGPIPEAMRAAIGNRIYGCDDCQLVCPWNKYAQRSALPDFEVRHGLDQATLLALWAWDASAFLANTEGSAIRRIGFERWRRNLAVALGNALRGPLDAALRTQIVAALTQALPDAPPLVAEHVQWALAQEAP